MHTASMVWRLVVRKSCSKDTLSLLHLCPYTSFTLSLLHLCPSTPFTLSSLHLLSSAKTTSPHRLLRSSSVHCERPEPQTLHVPLHTPGRDGLEGGVARPLVLEVVRPLVLEVARPLVEEVARPLVLEVARSHAVVAKELLVHRRVLHLLTSTRGEEGEGRMVVEWVVETTGARVDLSDRTEHSVVTIYGEEEEVEMAETLICILSRDLNKPKQSCEKFEVRQYLDKLENLQPKYVAKDESNNEPNPKQSNEIFNIKQQLKKLDNAEKVLSKDISEHQVVNKPSLTQPKDTKTLRQELETLEEAGIVQPTDESRGKVASTTGTISDTGVAAKNVEVVSKTVEVEGKWRGRRIQRIEGESGARLQFACRGPGYLRAQGRRLVTLTGRPEQVARAMDMVQFREPGRSEGQDS